MFCFIGQEERNHYYREGLQEVDFDARVAKSEEFASALERALASGKPAVVEVLTHPNEITVDATLADLREKAKPD
jgi:hypothetical protein